MIETDTKIHNHYQEQSYRFFNSFIFYTTALAANLINQSFLTINTQVQQYYAVSQTQVNLTSLIFLIIHPFMNVVANFTLNKFGLKFGTFIGGILVIIGVSVRLLINFNFSFVIVGNAIVATGNIFFLNSPTQLSANWFRPQIRWLSTGLAVCFAHLAGIGAAISPYFVESDLEISIGREKVFHLVLYQCIFISLVMIFNLIFFKGKPKNPPSPSGTKKRQQFLVSLKILIKNRNYMMIFFSLLFSIGGLSSLVVVIQPFMKPFGFNNKQISNIMIIFNVCSLFGVIICSLIIKKIKLIKKFVIFEAFTGVLFLVINVLFIWFQIKFLVFISMGIFSFFLSPTLPHIIQIACDVVFPVGQPVATGFILVGGQVLAFFTGLAQSYIVTGNSKQESMKGFIMVMSLLLTGFGLFCFIEEDYRRKKYDETEQETKGLTQTIDQNQDAEKQKSVN